MHNLTIHVVNTLPWSNLNRDDTGTPKRAMIGGVQRGMLSSQSIKRGVRTDYELKSGDLSTRSGNLSLIIAERACVLNSALDPKQADAKARKLVSDLVKNEREPKGDGEEKKVSSWLSAEEIDAAAHYVATQNTDSTKIIDGNRTGSLSIAAFGRMFAKSPQSNTYAAISVGPAMSVHKVTIETDYFSTVDDSPTEAQAAGSTFLGVQSYLSGVFYRTVTIDKRQLKANWTGFDSETARAQLTLLTSALIYKLPSGKKNSTSPYVAPLVALAEVQSHRLAYDFETPVLPGPDGGYGLAAVERLAAERKAALAFDPGNFGWSLAAGTAPNVSSLNADELSVADLTTSIVDWVLE